ncbi:hypothetical protein KSC_035280 [Ktedonobacter sp. SOSP1-52]|uniref:hypothetical protein n=1 Tax=Ktedonobacter sp. SOSP1-52 TaxID=2778366 RepID=UPI001915EE8E|nr:hypothetical protein [Ktedonobacter sp. SOSP1-52]GHO64636.1 hypothetical protein KSC_035280 [Ktedonobacter sp. SOSP1-52]
MLDCDGEHQASLLIAEYAADTFTVDSQAPGMYRYHSWLPIVKHISGSSGTVTYQSKSLSQLTGLPFLWISFNGYWPEKGVKLEKTTFKELEAYTVLSRLPEGFDDVLVVSSAGNTASAFAYICAVVLLNVTGGGWEHKRAHCRLIPASPALRICDSELASGDVMDRIMNLF